MEPKKVTINYALLCKQLEKQGKPDIDAEVFTVGYKKIREK